MSFTIVAKALDTLINVQIMQLCNEFQSNPVVPKKVTDAALMQTLNNPEVAWSIKIEKTQSVLGERLKPLMLKEFMSVRGFSEAKEMLKPDGVRSLPISLLSAALLLRMKEQISIFLTEAEEKIRNRSEVRKKIKLLEAKVKAVDLLLVDQQSADEEHLVSKKTEFLKAIESASTDLASKLIEESLKDRLCDCFQETLEIYTSSVRNSRIDDSFYVFLESVVFLLNESFGSLLAHQEKRPIFLDVDISEETPFVALSRRILFSYLLLAQLPDWGFREIRHAEAHRISDIQLVPENAIWRKSLQDKDIAQHKILAALGIFNCIHNIFSNPEQYNKFYTEIAQSIMNVLISFEAQTHQTYSLKQQRLEGLLILLKNACEEQFSNCQIELVQNTVPPTPKSWLSMFGQLYDGMTNMISAAAAAPSPSPSVTVVFDRAPPRNDASRHMPNDLDEDDLEESDFVDPAPPPAITFDSKAERPRTSSNASSSLSSARQTGSTHQATSSGQSESDLSQKSGEHSGASKPAFTSP